ncbi:hypothetical protein Tco_0973156 [Tanacetum coccineum]
MKSFRLLHSHLKVLSYNDLNKFLFMGGFERAFASLFDQDVQTFTSTMLLNLDQLQKQLEKDEFQEDRSMDAFWHTSKVDSSKALDADLVVMKSNGIESGKQDTSSGSGDYLTHVVDADIRPENETLKKHYKDLYDSIKVTRTKTIEQTTSLIAKNDEFEAQLQEKRFTIAALKNELRKLIGNKVNTKFAKPLVLGKLVLQPLRNQSVVRQPTVFRSERPKVSKPRFASQVDANNILSKPVNPHYLSKVRESVFVKPNHVIASGSSRNSSKESYGSNDIAHNYYIEEAKKKTQDKNMNLKPSVMHTTSLQNTANGSKPKPRSNNQTSKSFLVSKSGCGMSNGVPLVDHSRNSVSFSDSKHFVCSTCQKCVINANHDDCIRKFLKEVNSRAKVQSPKTRNKNKPVEPKSHTQKPGRQIAIGWIPTGKMFTDSTTKVGSEPPNGSNDDITNPYECDQTFNVSVGRLNTLSSLSYSELVGTEKGHSRKINVITAEKIIPEQAQRDKDMQKKLALIAKYFKKIYKPTNNNLRTSLNSRNKNMDTTPRYKNDNQTGQIGNQRTVSVVGARETVGSQETEKGERLHVSQGKMLLCKQAEKGVPLQAEQYDWLVDTNC